MSQQCVAIIGGGVSGLSVARYLLAQGFDVTIFESHNDFGGQWNRDNPLSGVWPDMRTNTAQFMTKLSDVDYPPDVAMFPRNGEVLAMLQEFAALHGLGQFTKFGVTVTGLSRLPAGYRVDWADTSTTHWQEFDRVVVATGRFNLPKVPDIAGLDSFTGAGGVSHAFHYKTPEAYRDMTIVVLGGSISALEVASEQAMMARGRVYLSQRRQRYVTPKMVAGTALEYFTFTLQGARALATTPKAEQLRAQKEFFLMVCGDPARYGAPAPHADVARAGVTGSQHYLNLVAENRIDVRPWVAQVDGRVVTFTDGSQTEADAIIIGTGFDLNLPFLSADIAQTVNLTTKSLDLADFTFHPDLPGLAFMGLWAQLGPYPVVLEQQARWIAYAWGGAVPMGDLGAALAACKAEGHHGESRVQHEMALRFAQLAGVDPTGLDDAELADIAAHSAVTGEVFRLTGPDADPEGANRLRKQFHRFAPPDVRRDIAARHGKPADG